MAITHEDAPISKNYAVLVSTYRRALKRLIKRIGGGKSIRRQAKEIRLSHTTLQNIIKAPEMVPKRKTMIKIIRGTVRPKTRKKFIIPITGTWFPNAI